MDPALQLILDTMNTRFDELDRRFADQDRALADRAAVVDSWFITLEVNHAATTTATVAALEHWLANLETIRI